MKPTFVLNTLLCSLLLAGCSHSDTPTHRYTFTGEQSFKLNAADVFRLSRELKSRQLVKSLKPLFGQNYYTEQSFKQSIEQAMGEPLPELAYLALVEKSRQAPSQLTLEFLSDSTLKVRFGSQLVPVEQQLLDTEQLSAPTVTAHSKHHFSTTQVSLKVDPQSLCVELSNNKQALVNQICPSEGVGFSLQTPVAYRYQGLGQEFQQPGNSDGAWNGRTRHSGNRMEGFNGGATGNTHIPILYAANANHSDFSIYFNNMYNSEWSVDDNAVSVKAAKGASEIVVAIADDQSQLRQQFMQLSGTPLVPPRKMFGLWLSEYGFDNWQEMDDKLETLAQNDFPLDGVVMDLQWFGNVKPSDPMSQMGTLTWDRANFPEPEQKIAQLKQQGIGMMLIEESYVSEGLEEHQVLEQKGMLAKDPETGLAINVDPSGVGSWWGNGSMIDWSNPAANTFWHEWKRQPLIEMGVMGHWTDLGEPEMYNHKGEYFNGKPHDDVHNLFNYYWLQGIHQGYQDNKVVTRPFTMSRSGTTGVQKFGTSMWSADIGSNLTSLAVHIGQQTNMMLSGIDYYGSDIGGFHRKGLGAIGEKKVQVLNETYTQWFAYSSLFDVPVRPHTENLCNCKETAPDRVGDLVSNRNNIALRYEMIPYLYSLAHIAHQQGQPVFPSVGYVFPRDELAQTQHKQKMIGESLMGAAIAELCAKQTKVYFPEGNWFDYHTGKSVDLAESREVIASLVNDKGEYQLPLYAREGAIIPVAKPSSTGWDSSVPEQLSLQVFGTKQSAFTLYEDDGETNAYLNGELRATEMSLARNKQGAQLTIVGKGDYQGMREVRDLTIDWLLDEGVVIESLKITGDSAVEWKQMGNRLMITVADVNTSMATKIKLVY